MKIALLVVAPEWGGAELHTVQFARALSERGHAVTVACLTERTYESYRQRSPHHVSLCCLNLSKPWDEMGFRDWLRLFADRSWDACILVKGTFFVGDWAIDLAARYRFGNYFTVEHLQGPPVPQKSSQRHFGVIPGVGLWWYKERFSRFFRCVGPRKVFCVSGAVSDRLTKDYHFPRAKTAIVPNGIDAKKFRHDPVQRKVWRQHWNVPEGALVFGALGRFNKVKGYETALIGFQALLEHFPDKDVRLVLVGEGQQEQQLRSIAEKIVPNDRVIFAPFCERPWEALCALDMFVMPSLNEGLPLTLLEAMASGCCPVANAVGGIPEVLCRPELGWLVPAGDTDAFAKAMIDAASKTAEQRGKMAEQTRSHVVTNFNATIQFNLLVDGIESCVPASCVPTLGHAA